MIYGCERRWDGESHRPLLGWQVSGRVTLQQLLHAPSLSHFIDDLKET